MSCGFVYNFKPFFLRFRFSTSEKLFSTSYSFLYLLIVSR